MEARELQGCDSDGGFNMLICQEDFHNDELKTYRRSNRNKLQGTRSYMSGKTQISLKLSDNWFWNSAEKYDELSLLLTSQRFYHKKICIIMYLFSWCSFILFTFY